MRIKVCGITNLADALNAADAGADALGFVFVESSPRWVSPATAGKIIDSLPPSVTPVAVVRSVSAVALKALVEQLGVRTVQYHGDADPDIDDIPGITLVRALRVGDGFDPASVCAVRSTTVLLDSYVDGLEGGTGKAFDWGLARAAGANKKIIIAGGLHPDNVHEAISRARPYGVDASSRLESSPGKKDSNLVRLFVSRAREAFRTTTAEQP